MEFFAKQQPGAMPTVWTWTLGSLVLLLAWDASGLDLTLARFAADGHGFAWRDSWIAKSLLHDGMHQLALACAAWLLAGIWWPVGILRDLPRAARVQWLASALAGSALISLLKHWSQTSCPWDLVEFGGTAAYVSHWAFGHADGGPGHCFPAGHASAAFAFVGGFFALRPISPHAARICLALVFALGLVLGLAQQFRGAHFMSHTLWTAWLCWAVSWFVDGLARWLAQERSSARACHEVS